MPTYDYAVTEVIRVVDGDTVDLRVDLGFHMTTALRFRILDVDTPERSEPGWADATAITRSWLGADERTLRARTAKADSFGRWLAEVYDATTLERLAEHVIAAMDRRGVDCRWRP